MATADNPNDVRTIKLRKGFGIRFGEFLHVLSSVAVRHAGRGVTRSPLRPFVLPDDKG
jgi:hypothetical protein